MNEFIQKSESINELASALAKAQGLMKPAEKNSSNPHFRSKFADIASIHEVCKGPLSSNGLSVSHFPSAIGNVVSVVTLLMHSSGQWISTELKTQAKDALPQSIGSCITYVRRYNESAILNIASEEEDDGNAGQGIKTSAPSENKAPLEVYDGRQEHKAYLWKLLQRHGVDDEGTAKNIHALVMGKPMKDLEAAVHQIMFKDI